MQFKKKMFLKDFVLEKRGLITEADTDLNPKTRKMYLLKRGGNCFFVTFNIIISHIFPENFIDIPQIVQKM